MRRVMLVLLVTAVVAGVVGYMAVSQKGGTSTVTIRDPKLIPKYAVAFVRNPYKDDYDLSRIAGYVDNLGTTRIIRAHLEIQLVDSSGNRKELVKYDVTSIGPRSRKSFDANAGGLPASRRSTAKITVIEVVK